MNNLFKALIKALLTCVITAAVLIFIFAFIASRSNDSTKNLELFGKTAFFITSLFGSVAASFFSEERHLTASLVFSAVFISICFALSLIMGTGMLSKLWLPYLGALGLGVVGALVGSKRKPKKPKNLKKFKKQTR